MYNFHKRLFFKSIKRYSILFAIFLCACQQEDKKQILHITPYQQNRFIKIKKSVSSLERQFISKQLVDVQTLDSTIKVALTYSTPHNFLHKIIYANLSKCYLPCEVAIKLCNAQWYLKQLFPQYTIVVFDATRPLSAQQKMWDELDLAPAIKINYLAHPSAISLHNYGAAVDVGLAIHTGELLDMGTTFDSFEALSQPIKEWQFLKEKKLTQQAYENRVLLRKVMRKAGFTSISSEWWHFNATNKCVASQKYELIQ